MPRSELGKDSAFLFPLLAYAPLEQSLSTSQAGAQEVFGWCLGGVYEAIAEKLVLHLICKRACYY